VAGWPALYFAGRPGCRRAAAAAAPPAIAEPGACGRAAALVACEHAAAAVWAGRQGATDWVSEQGAALWASWQHIRTFGQPVACSVGKHNRIDPRPSLCCALHAKAADLHCFWALLLLLARTG